MTFNTNTSLASHIGFAAFSAMYGSNERHSNRPRTMRVRKTDSPSKQITQESRFGSAITLTVEAATHLLQTKQGALAAMLQGTL